MLSNCGAGELLRVLGTACRSNQSILKEIKPEYLLEGLMLKLKLNTLATLWEELTPKDPDPGKDWRQQEKGTTEDEMVGWHPDSMDMSLRNSERERGQGSLACYSPWGPKESDMTEQLNSWTTTTKEIRMGVERGSGKWEQFCGSRSGPNIRPKWWGSEEEGPGVTVGLRNSIISRFPPLALFSCSFSFWSFIYMCTLGWAAWVSI